MKLRLEITYAAGGEPQVHETEDPGRALTGLHAFVSDMVALEGSGVRKVSMEVLP